MINIMKPVFRNQQYGGQKFRNDEEYYRFMKENPQHLFIGNALSAHGHNPPQLELLSAKLSKYVEIKIINNDINWAPDNPKA